MSLKLKFALFLFSLNLMFSGCDEKNDTKENGSSRHGGTLKINENNFILSLDPPKIFDPYSIRVSRLIFETLFELDETSLMPKPCLIKSYTIDSTQTEYTFKLKENIRFHKSKCLGVDSLKTLNVDDVKYSFSRYFEIHQKEVFTDPFINSLLIQTRSENETPWFQKLDENTFKIKLKSPNKELINILSLPQLAIYPEKIFECYTEEQFERNPIGTGPFKLNEIQTGSRIILERNPHYHQVDNQNNSLPYLDFIKYSFNNNKEEEYKSFLKGEIDFIEGLPINQFNAIYNDLINVYNSSKSQFKFDKTKSYKFYFLGINTNNSSLNSKNPVLGCFPIESINKRLDNNLFSQRYVTDKKISTQDYLIELINEIKIQNLKTKLDNSQNDRSANALMELSLDGFKLWVDQNDEKAISVAKLIVEEFKALCNQIVSINPVPYSVLKQYILSGDNFLYIDKYSQNSSSDIELITFLINNDNNTSFSMEKKSSSYFNYLGLKNDSLSANTKSVLIKTLLNKSTVQQLWIEENYLIYKPFVKNLSNNPTQYRTFKDVYFQKPETLSGY